MTARAAFALAAVLASTAASAQQFTVMMPAGGTRGETVRVTCYGRYLKDTVSVVWLRDGIEVTNIAAERDDRVRLELAIPEDCGLGEYPFQLHTKRGLTRAQGFYVGAMPSVAEGKDHGSRDRAQRIGLDCTVDGRVLPDDEDWYAFDVEQGQAVRVEVEAVRLAVVDLDLQLEVFDPDGERVVRSDDSTFARADPVARFVAARTGTYTMALRDVAWRGSSRGVYRLHVGTFPRPIGALPAGGAPGSTVECTLVGDIEPQAAVLEMPKAFGIQQVFPVVDGVPSPTPIRVIVDRYPSFVEGEVPDGAKKAPCAFHGVVTEPGEEDRYAFTAKKGGRYDIGVLARNLRSTLDPVVRVRDAQNKVLGTDDDSLGLDGRVRFTAPSDGTFYACVSDHLERGSPTNFYRLLVRPVRGGTGLNTREAIPGRRIEDFGVSVPVGRRNATVIATSGLSAKNGDTLSFTDLPPGVRSLPTAVPAGGTIVPVVFEVAADAELAASLASPLSTSAQRAEPRRLPFRHSYAPLRVQNNQPYGLRQVRSLPVAITQATPYDIAADPPAVPLVQSGSMKWPVRLTRDEGFDGTVTVRALWLPPGVSGNTISLTKGKTAGALSLNANSRASVGTWPIVLIASARSGSVTQTISTQVMHLDVHAPWVTAKLPRATIEQGQKGVFPIELQRQREFEGKVTAELARVPRGVKTAVPAIADETTTVEVALDAAADARVGRHRTMYLRLKIETDGGVIQHTVGGGELRVDRPLPEKMRKKGEAR